ncbi:MAG: hypothetical protein V8S69_03855 [Dakarella massiliensis]
MSLRQTPPASCLTPGRGLRIRRHYQLASQRCCRLRLGSGPITPDIIRLASQALAKAGYIDQLNLTGLKPDRRDIIAGGFAVLAALFKVFRIQELNLATGSLRTGIFYDLSGL